VNVSPKLRAMLTRSAEAFAFAFCAVEVAAPTSDLLSTTTLKGAALSGFAALVAFIYNGLRGPATHAGD
jgi:hypothetical protein